LEPVPKAARLALDAHLSKTAKIKKFAVDFKGFTAQEIEISKRGSLFLETP